MATSAAAVQDEPATKFAKDQLKAIIERIERLEEEKKTISDDIRDVYAEAKGNGFDVKALRTIVRLRKQDANERAEEETILETYMQALGMLLGANAAGQSRGLRLATTISEFTTLRLRKPCALSAVTPCAPRRTAWRAWRSPIR